MAPTTVFLIVLIISLLIGNALLFFVGRRGGQAKASGSQSAVLKDISAAVASQASPMPGQSAGQDRSLIPIETKIELAHRRIQELEAKLRDSGTNGSPSTDDALKRKIEKLDSFRSIAESELIAIKEILVELQDRHITAKSRTYKGKGKKEVSGEKLHKIIYRSAGN